MSIYITKNGTKEKFNISATDVQLLDINGNFENTNLEDAMLEVYEKIHTPVVGAWDMIPNKPSIDKGEGEHSIQEGYMSTATGNYSHAEGVGCKAIGLYAHAQGYGTTASGIASHTEGYSTTAEGENAHAEGYKNTASGDYSHAEGIFCTSSGSYSHAEGNMSWAAGNGSHAEGQGNAEGNFSHAEGSGTYARGNFSHAEGVAARLISVDGEGRDVIAEGIGSHAEGCGTYAKGNQSHAEGFNTSAYYHSAHVEGDSCYAYGECAHAEGYKTIANGAGSHAEGYNTMVTKRYGHAEGYQSVVSGDYAHAEGYKTTASGAYAHSEGSQTTASGARSHAGGMSSIAQHPTSYAFGQGTITNFPVTFAIGSYNVDNSTPDITTWQDLFVIGSGSSTARSNCFRVTKSAVYGGTYNTSGADYAEYFEWLDGNGNDEDRTGLFVTLDGDKIRIANKNDSYILGVVSANASIIGNAEEDQWTGMYLKDDFGRVLVDKNINENEVTNVNINEASEQEDYSVKHNIEDEKDEDCTETLSSESFRVNPLYDNTKTYIPRSQRKEWSPIGMLGQLVVKDDGTCEVNGYCTTSDNGIATKADTGYRVIKRINDNLISIILK